MFLSHEARSMTQRQRPHTWVSCSFIVLASAVTEIMLLFLLPVACFLIMARCTPQCFQQRPHLPRLNPPIMLDCLNVASFIIHGDKSSAPMTFSRNPSRGFRVPYYWDHLPGTCVVYIDMISSADEDTFPMTWIASKVADIVETCLMDRPMPGLGGCDLVGPNQRMRVFMGGRLEHHPRNQSNSVIPNSRISSATLLEQLQSVGQS